VSPMPTNTLLGQHSEPLAAADSGASTHYIGLQHASHVVNVRPTTNPIRINFPNGQTASSTHEAELSLPNLPQTARKVHLFRDTDIEFPLISIGQLCDADCQALFIKTMLRVSDTNNTTILNGTVIPTQDCIWWIYASQ
jgi:hypothetical protein